MTGAELIAAERKRQIEQKEWTPEHDDEHTDGSLALAAVCYATPVLLYQHDPYALGFVFADPWPESWSDGWDKRYSYGERKENPGNMPPDPATYTEDERLDLLVKAGALLAAEIDRRLRAREKTANAIAQEREHSERPAGAEGCAGSPYYLTRCPICGHEAPHHYAGCSEAR